MQVDNATEEQPQKDATEEHATEEHRRTQGDGPRKNTDEHRGEKYLSQINKSWLVLFCVFCGSSRAVCSVLFCGRFCFYGQKLRTLQERVL